MLAANSGDSWTTRVVEPCMNIIKSFLYENISLVRNSKMLNCSDIQSVARDLWTQYVCEVSVLHRNNDMFENTQETWKLISLAMFWSLCACTSYFLLYFLCISMYHCGKLTCNGYIIINFIMILNKFWSVGTSSVVGLHGNCMYIFLLGLVTENY